MSREVKINNLEKVMVSAFIISSVSYVLGRYIFDNAVLENAIYPVAMTGFGAIVYRWGRKDGIDEGYILNKNSEKKR